MATYARARDLERPAPWAEIVPDAGPMTAGDLLEMADDGWQYEVIEGLLVRMAGCGQRATVTAMIIGAAPLSFARPRSLGRVTGAGGVFSFPDARTGLIPDVGFFTAARAAQIVDPDRPIPFAPDLAVEVASPKQGAAEMAAKARLYLLGGTRLVWVVWLRTQTVDVWRAGDADADAPSATLGAADALDGEDVVPGFAHPLADLFAA